MTAISAHTPDTREKGNEYIELNLDLQRPGNGVHRPNKCTEGKVLHVKRMGQEARSHVCERPVCQPGTPRPHRSGEKTQKRSSRSLAHRFGE